MQKQLEGAPLLVGSELSLADIALVASARVADRGGFHLGDYPAVKAWVSRVEGSLGLGTAG